MIVRGCLFPSDAVKSSILTITRLCLAAGFALDQVLRVNGHTDDVTLNPGGLVLQIIWAVLLIGLVLLLNCNSFSANDTN